MAIDLKKLEKYLDDALAKETPESLTKWLNERRQKLKKKSEPTKLSTKH